MKKIQYLLLMVAMIPAVGCRAHAQIAPTAYQVQLAWTAPVASGSWGGCTVLKPCSYVISRITLADGTAACPATNVAAANYTALNAAAPATGNSYADPSSAGLTVCYIAQTQQPGTPKPVTSQPSAVVGPYAVPASPLAPTLSGNQTLSALQPMPMPAGNSHAPALTARLLPAPHPSGF